MTFLRKPTDFLVLTDDPFKNDKLSRLPIALTLTQIIENLGQPFTVSLEAPWGYGKTTFVRMWMQYLKNLGFECLLFNAWESDYSDDPLVTFLGELDKFIQETEKEIKNYNQVQKQMAKVRKIAGEIILDSLPIFVQVVSHGIITSERIKALIPFISGSEKAISEKVTEGVENQIKEYKEEKQTIRSFKAQLAILAKELTQERKTPLVIFLDELDRCRPTYAVQFLERIKHLFNVENVLFVLSIDSVQLSNTIRAIYGQATDTDGYLRRIIDYRFNLPAPLHKEFCVHLAEIYSLDQKLESLRPGLLKLFIDTTSMLFAGKGFSLRKQEQCFIQIDLALKTLPNLDPAHCYLIPLFAVMKNSDEKIYSAFKNKTAQWEDVASWLNEDVDGKNIQNTEIAWLLEAIHTQFILKGQQRDAKIEKIAQNAKASGGNWASMWRSIQPYLDMNIGPNEIIIKQLDLLYEIERT